MSTAVVLLLVILLLLLATADDDGVDKDDDDDGAAEVEDEEEGCDVEDVEELDRICSKSPPGGCCVDVLAANMIVSTCVSAILSYTVFLGSLH